MDLSGALPDEVILEVFDEEWVQAVDYEHVPFECCKCHEHGHLFRDCPLNKMESKTKSTSAKEIESFNKVGNRGKHQKKINEEKQPSQNRYKVLEEEEEHDKVNQTLEDSPMVKEKVESIEDTQDNNKKKEDLLNTMELYRDQEVTPSKVGTKDHELQEILDREHLDLEKFLEQGTTKGMDSLPQE